MRSHLAKPVVKAALTTSVLAVISVLVVLVDDLTHRNATELSPLSPDASEVALLFGWVLFAFVVLWGVFALAARLGTKRR